jgi:hypothetical protein
MTAAGVGLYAIDNSHAAARALEPGENADRRLHG